MRQVTQGIVLAVGLLMALSAVAQPTQVGGAISSDATWSGTIQVTSTVTVEGSATLTIEPGTTVEFMGPHQLVVEGVLQAVGSYSEPAPGVQLLPSDVNWITFTQDTSGLALLDGSGTVDPDSAGWDQLWGGIRFDESASGSRVEWAVIEWSSARGSWPDNNGGAIFVRATSPHLQHLVLRNCFADNFGGGIFLWSTASVVRNIAIADCYAGVAGGGIYIDQSAISLQNLTIAHCVTGSAQARGNAIFFGPGADENTVRSCAFYANYSGSQTSNDQSYYYAGHANNYIGDIRYSFDTALGQDDLTRALLAGDENNLASGDSALASFRVEFPGYYVGQPQSIMVDNGVPDASGVSDEPSPNGGPGGPRINIGAWGGTPMASRSLAVAESDPNPFLQSAIKPNEVGEITATLTNVGSGLLILHPDSLVWDHLTDNPRPRFEVVDFEPRAVRPDSTDAVIISYSPVAGDEVDFPGGQLIDTLRMMHPNGDIRWNVKGLAKNPILVVNTDLRDFGTVNIGSPDTLDLPVTNDGTSNLVLGFSFASANSPYRRFDNGASLTLAADTTHIFRFVCDPRRVGDLEDELRISSNDVAVTSIEFTAFGQGPQPSYPDEDSLYFAFVDVDGGEQLDTLTVFNNGNDDFVINDMVTTDAAFSVAPAAPQTIAAGDSLNIVIRFAPSTLGVYDDTLYFETDLVFNDHEILLAGRGTTGGQYFSNSVPNAFGIDGIWGDDEGEDTYICAGPTVVPPGKTVTVLPGVQILFEGNGYIEVQGTLEMMGAPDNRIVLRPQLGQRHGGLRLFASEPGTRLHHVLIDSGRSWTLAEIAEYEDIDEDEVEINIPDFRAHGGGLSIYNTDPLIQDVEITNSYSHQDGGGIWAYQAQPSLVRVLVHDNLATTHGGGISLFGATPLMHASQVMNNVAGDAGETGHGGGIYMRSRASATLTNSIISGNSASGKGGAAYMVDYSSPMLLNDVFHGNSAADGENAIHVAGGSLPQVKNSVIYQHTGSSLQVDANASVIASYSVIEGGFTGGTSIISAAPEFDPGSDPPFEATAGGNLIDAGDPATRFEDFSFPPSKGGVRSDIGAYGGPYGNSWGQSPLSLSFFFNTVNRRGLHFVVNALGSINGAPSLEVTDFSGNTAVPLDAVNSSLGVYAADYIVQESTTLRVRASANNGNVSLRRDYGVAVFTSAAGGSFTDPGSGISLKAAPGTAASDLMLVGQESLRSTLPDQTEPVISAGPRWAMQASRQQFGGVVELSMPYDRSVVRDGHEAGVAIWRETEDGWQRLESLVDRASGRVLAEIHQGGSYAVFYQSVGGESALLPTETALGANYPNPFNPTTSIPFQLAGRADVKLTVYNVLGQQMVVLRSGVKSAGHHVAVWDGRDRFGRAVASGVYFYRLEASPVDGSARTLATRKLVLMR